ncbi:hypothetical protein [uncultured Psychroserpens sp.]|uniref:hypothetical protein n=1 Tax=uncultured Psychroserpens sp. TaxID=255436 RepID=UPI00260BB3C4|nr:hypothetical protein [uncultured Psychroserpens sp.]
MNSEQLVNIWFEKWNSGDFMNLPITYSFEHTSPFGIVKGKKAYIDLIKEKEKENETKFLGYSFELQDTLYKLESACVHYTARQGPDFCLDVSEWYYFKNNLIDKVIAYYHIGDIREERLYKS